MNLQIVWIIIAAAGLWLLWMIMMKLGEIAAALNKPPAHPAGTAPHQAQAFPQIVHAPAAPDPVSSLPEYCRLTGVDDETAAIIMAIVTDRHPGEALRFVSIKAL